MQHITEILEIIENCRVDQKRASFVRSDISWLSAVHTKCIAKNVENCLNIFNNRCPTLQKIEDLNKRKNELFSAANDSNDILNRRVFGLLIAYYGLFVDLLAANSSNSSTCNYDKLTIKLYSVLKSMCEWHIKLQQLFSIDDICEDYSNFIFMPNKERIDKAHQGRGAVYHATDVESLDNQLNITNPCYDNARDTVQDVSLLFKIPSCNTRKIISVWGKTFFLTDEFQFICLYFRMVSFFQQHIKNPKALSECLRYKKHCVEKLVTHLKYHELQDFFRSQALICTNVARDSTDDNKSGENISHILQESDSWLINYLISLLSSIKPQHDHACTGNITNVLESPIKRLKLQQ